MDTNQYLKSFQQELILRGKAKKTIVTYISATRKCLEFLKKEPLQVNSADVREYILLLKSRGLALLALVYSGGLRLNEARFLKITDIDSKRMKILVNGKGNKQRYTLLAQTTLELLRDYYKKYRPQAWLFENIDSKPYSQRAIDSIIRKAVKKTGYTHVSDEMVDKVISPLDCMDNTSTTPSLKPYLYPQVLR